MQSCASLGPCKQGTRASLLVHARGCTRARSEGMLLRNINGCALAHRRCRCSTSKAVHSCAMEMRAFEPKRCRLLSLDVWLLCTHGYIAHACVSGSSIDNGCRLLSLDVWLLCTHGYIAHACVSGSSIDNGCAHMP